MAISVRNYLQMLIGKRCWYASCGGSAGSSFILSLGGKLRRVRPVNNSMHPPEYRQYIGEYCLSVWSTWRFVTGVNIDASSLSEDDMVQRILESLVGATISDIVVREPVPDLIITFDNQRVLEVLCSGTADTFDADWEIILPHECLSIGPCGRTEIERRGDIELDEAT